ncbi:MAG: hypothetical protein CL946_11905 [Ectothiorhodospiraceae bacterium]|nr:hypothetical protein [Ectothiorhodospiraceae bacterium]
MNRQRKTEIRVGATVLVGLAILLTAFSVFKDWDILSDSYSLRISFPTSAGLQSGDKVMLNGVEVGEVEYVRLEDDHVIVGAMISEGQQIDAESVPRIQMLELMGGKKIEIAQGNSGQYLEPGETLEGIVDPDIPGALQRVGDLEGKIVEITNSTNELLHNANNIIGDEQFVDQLKRTVVDMRALVSDVRGMIAENRSELHSIASSSDKLLKKTDSLLTEYEPHVKTTLESTDTLLVNTNDLVVELRATVQELRETNSVANALLFDEELNRRFDTLLTKVDSVFTLILIEEGVPIKVGF